MAFDGQDRDAAPFIWPNAYASGAPLDGSAVSSSLEAAYFAARRNSQLLYTVASTYNGQRPGVTVGTASYLVSSSYVRWSENFAYIPKEATHLEAHMVYAALPIGDVTGHFRMAVYDSLNTLHTGTEVVQNIPAGFATIEEAAQAFATIRDVSSLQGITNRGGVFEAHVEVEVPETDYQAKIYTEGYLLHALGITFRPLVTTVFWSIREAGTP